MILFVRILTVKCSSWNDVQGSDSEPEGLRILIVPRKPRRTGVTVSWLSSNVASPGGGREFHPVLRRGFVRFTCSESSDVASCRWHQVVLKWRCVSLWWRRMPTLTTLHNYTDKGAGGAEQCRCCTRTLEIQRCTEVTCRCCSVKSSHSLENQSLGKNRVWILTAR